MTDNTIIRPTTSGDLPTLEQIYKDAFPEEDLIPLLRALENHKDGILSLASTTEGDITGHIVCTISTVEGYSENIALMGPLAVSPPHQKQGIGSALINEACHQLTEKNVPLILVLGDPNYYGRSGFKQEDNIAPPYPIPDEWKSAWQSKELTKKTATIKGTLSVPAPWQNPALWA